MTVDKARKVGGLLLAAGGSSRFGRPKQLATFDGRTLIRRATETLAGSACDPIVVVLGAELEGSMVEIADLRVEASINQDWQSGMSSSIRLGVEELFKFEPQVVAVVIALCDQPLINSAEIDQLVDEYLSSGVSVVASVYAGTVGVPALFARELFPDLMRLDGDKGASGIIRTSENVAFVEMENAAFDIDSMADLQRHDRG